MTVTGASVRTRAAAAVPAEVPLPELLPLDAPRGILVAGVGGTGVLTIGALLGMAAHIEGKACTTLDFTGMAQKNGAVTSHVRIAARPEDLHAVRLSTGGADVLLACDLVVAASPANLARLAPGRTHAIVNSAVVPTAGAVLDRDFDMQPDAMQRALARALGRAPERLDATGLALAVQGDAIAANLVLLGYAFQKGWLPLSLEALERAIELNGVDVDASKRAFAWGRLAAHDPHAVARVVGAPAATASTEPADLAGLMRLHRESLTAYQDARYADRYARALAPVVEADRRCGDGRDTLAMAAARSLHRLMAYKDEYEVARLYTDGSFREALAAQFAGDLQVEFHLAPPLLARKDPVTGVPRKKKYGPWMFRAMRVLAGLRGLRGTPFDPFGRTEERRTERELVVEFERVLERIAREVNDSNYATAVALAGVPLDIRGYGHVKMKSIAPARARMQALLAVLGAPQAAPARAPATAAAD